MPPPLPPPAQPHHPACSDPDSRVYSGGLKQTGPINGKCSQSTGQLYVRSGNHRNRFGILYAYYFPKEEPSPSVGHRHDWQSLVLWKADDKINSTLLGVATSVHGQYHQYPYAQNRDDWDDNHPLVSYVNTWLLSYYLAPSADNTPVQPLPMIDWDSLPDVAQYALNNADFGDAAVPFKDDNFDLHLEKAWLDHV